MYDLSGDESSVGANAASPPLIGSQPQSQLLSPNDTVVFSVTASGGGLTYQWLFNGIPITGATGDSLVLTNLSGTNASCSVMVSNALGVVTSTPAAIWPDSRGVGMPDWWQMQYFGNLNQPPDGDYDGDGVSNINEYHEGTNPADATSYHPRLSFLYSPHGYVVQSPNLPYYTLGQIVTLTAVPDPGQEFLSWSGNIIGSKPVVSLVMDSHKLITARFGLPLAIALDNTNLVWTSGGNAPWFGQTEVSEDGLGSAQTGLIYGSQQSWLQTVTNVSQPMQLSFWWDVSSQAPDALYFSVDGTTVASIAGETVPWQQVRTSLAAGNHVLQWTYSKQAYDLPTGLPFADSGWVDEVTISPVPHTVQFTIPSGAVAWWRAEGNAFDSIGTNDGTLVNAASYAAGEVGQAFSLDGVSARVALPESPAIDLSRISNWTIECWVFPTNVTSQTWPTIYSKGRWAASLGLNNGTAKLESWINNANQLVGTVAILLNSWSHVALTYDGTNRIFYVNGIPAGSGSAPVVSPDTNAAAIGDVAFNPNSSRFSGRIDELALYSRALAASEIASIYNAGLAGKAFPPLMLHSSIQGSQVLLSFNGTPGKSYTVQTTTGLNPAAWETFSNLTAASSNASCSDALTNSSQRFYRVTTRF